jgi:hypothetical protein
VRDFPILREELKFAKFIVRMQQDFAAGIKNGFVTHLQLKGLMKDFELKEHNIDISFNVPTNFYELRESQKLELKVNNFSTLAANETISPSFAQKRYLGWSDIDIKANREFLRKDKELKWELTQIETNGPNWKEMVASQAEAASEAGAGIADGGGGGGGVPAFTGGPAGPEPTGEEGAPPAGETPEAGAPPAGQTPPSTPAQ